ncbi:MAG: MATE family efflux transporter [Nitratireductor sp.]
MSLASIMSNPALRPWGVEAKATIVLAWPLVLTNLAQILVNSTDVLMMGWLGPGELAAGALAFNLYFAFMIFGIGLVNASAPLMASELGKRNHAVREVRRTVRQMLWICIAIALPVWMALWQTEAILRALGQDPKIAANAAAYMHTLQWSYLPSLAYLTLRSFLSALQRPRWALAVGTTTVAVNAFANWCLMFGNLGAPNLGLVGAGVGSFITSLFTFGALSLVVLTDRQFRRYYLFGNFWRADWERFRAIWKIGIPIALTSTFEVTVFNAAALLMGVIGTAALAAHTIALQLCAVSFMVPLGFSQAAAVRVGRAYGANDETAMMRAGWTPFIMGVGFMGMMAIIMMSVPHLLIGVFLDSADPANANVIPLAVSFLFIAALFQVFDGAQVIGAGMLRGLQDTRVPMVYAALGYWIGGLGVGALLAFPLHMNGFGIWIGLASGLAIVSALLTLRWARRDGLGLTLPPWARNPA